MATERSNSTTKTYDEIAMFRNQASMYIMKFRDRTPLHYALEKALGKTKQFHEDYVDKQNDLRVDYALIKKDTGEMIMLSDGVTPAINPEKHKAFQQKARELSRTKITWYTKWVSTVPKDLDAGWFSHFVGFVIHPDEDPFIESEETEPQPEKTE